MRNRNILFIPHTPHTHIRVRSFEFARCLAAANNVFYLLWDELNDFGLLGGMKRRITSVFRSSFWGWNVRPEIVDGVNVLRDVPKACAPEWYANRRNGLTIERIVREYGIDLVVNSAFSLSPVGKSDGVEYVYDLVDDPFAETNARSSGTRRMFIRNEINKADVVTTCSVSLAEFVRKEWGREAVFMPNGADVAGMRRVTDADIAALKRSLGVEGKKLVGFISNFEPWNGLDFLADVFQLLERMRDNICLVLVGSGKGLDSTKERLSGMRNVVLAGRVDPKEVAVYFRAIDLGVLPFEMSNLTHRAFPLKVVEYGAARKPVVAVPLDELKLHGFPNVRLVKRDAREWAEAICESVDQPWDDQWDLVYSRFDWPVILTEKLAPFLRGAPDAYGRQPDKEKSETVSIASAAHMS